MADPFLGGFGLGGEFSGAPSLLGQGFSLEKPDNPIELTGSDLRRFNYRFFDSFESSKFQMYKVHEDALINQAVYEMVNRISPIDGTEQYTTPMSRNTANGVVAHIKDAIEQPQLFGFKTRSFGALAAEATQTAALCAAMLEREVEVGGSRAVITSDTVRSAVFMGTAVTPMRLSSQKLRNDEQFFYWDEPIPLTNFFVDRVSTRNLWETNCFYYDRQRMYTLEEMALTGILDQDAVEMMMNSHITNARTFGEDLLEFDEHHRFAAENALVTILYGYMRFRPEGSKYAKLYEAIADISGRKFLSLRCNPYEDAYDSPPLNLWRIGTMPNSLFGTGILQRLKNTQQMMDREINNYFQYSDKLAQPPYIYREKSWIGEKIKREGQGAIRAGMAIPSKYGDLNDLSFLDWKGNPNVSFGSMQVIQKLKEDATYTNEALSSTDSRKTLGQTQIEAQRGTLNLRVDLSDFANDAAIAGEMFWRAIVAYKIRKSGVVEVYKGGKLLAYNIIKGQELNQITRQLIYQKLLTGEMLPDEAAAFQIEFNQKLTNGKIPHVNRLDLAVSLTGTKIIADKMSELAMLERLTQYITALLPAASQDSHINMHLRSLMLAMGIKDTDLRMPSDPNKNVMDSQEFQALTLEFNQILQKSALQ